MTISEDYAFKQPIIQIINGKSANLRGSEGLITTLHSISCLLKRLDKAIIGPKASCNEKELNNTSRG